MNRTGWIAVSLLLLGCCQAASADDFSAADIEFFEKHVRPILVANCHECHSRQVDEPDAGLRLDSRASILTGGDSGPGLIPGNLDESRLLTAVSYDDVDLQMPPEGKLPAEDIEHLREWVRRGAPWPAESADEDPAETKKSGFDLAARKAAHWAWHPLQESSPPEVQNSAWPRSDADRFLLGKLEDAGIAPAAEADRRTWIRRVTFDLIGLPPSIAEIDAFLADESPDAHAHVVDRLLASPHFGERWARHWFDLVRYAETKGHEFDYPGPNAWQYRDYVIRAFNADVPYDQFVIEHLAGDMLAAPRLNPEKQFNESIIGTGFWFLGEEVHAPVDTRQDQADRFDNRIDVFSKTFLGLTVACARCHDHKFDAIAAKDYYALYGLLESSTWRLARFDTIERDRLIARELAAVDNASQAPLRRAVMDVLSPGVESLAASILASVAPTSDISVAQAWRKHLTAALDAPDDPFHAAAQQLLRPPTATATAANCDVPATVETPPQDEELVVDYAALAPGQWLPDEVSYGMHPTPAGTAYVQDAHEIRFVERTAAEFDRAWDLRTLATDHQLENGALGHVVRPGRTLCTPMFQVRGKIYYLVRGAGQVYAAVDQNSLIMGPLHTTLIQPFDTKGEWKWIERNLTYYDGHHIHLEFTPNAQGKLSIARVVQADQPPQLTTSPLQVVNSASNETAGGIAAACRQRFITLLDRLASDAQLSADDARLANWALDHVELFAVDRATLAARLEPVVATTTAARATVLAQIEPESRLCMAMQDVSGVDDRVFLRGSPRNLGDVAPRRGPEAIFGDAPLDAGTTSGRLELARQMVDPTRNPLLARVMVNRVWHHLFGRGIVASVDNFGVMGDAPTHPELLDDLAAHYAQNGWSTKQLIRELALSSAYRMASHGTAEAEAADVRNLLLHRTNVRRLEGEAIRDAMLKVSGSLDETLYGRSIPIYLNDFMDGRGRPTASGPLDGANRRSLYIEMRRNFLSPMMLAFDMPVPFSTVGKRNVSNVPAQSLVMLNDPLVHELSERWAARICKELPTPQERIDHMYQEAFGRPPSDAERSRCETFLEQQDAATAWKDLAHALWNVKEFVFVY